MQDRISIVVPVFNVEKYLNRCIDSILRQSFSDFELILVDDGSTDNSNEICRKYERKDKRIKVVCQENKGLSAARNAGIAISTGTFITFIDSDDWIDDYYLEKLYNLLVNNNADISICNFLKKSDNSTNEKMNEIEIFNFTNIEALNQLSSKFYIQIVIACGKLYRRKLFCGILFPTGKAHEDEFVTYKLIYKAKNIVFTTEQLYYYWQRSDSIMGKGFDLQNKLDAIEALHERAIFFKDVGQIKLETITYKSLFGLYQSVNSNLHLLQDTQLKREYLNSFMAFKFQLRSHEYSFLYKIYYEIYFVSPEFANILQKSVLNIRLFIDKYRFI